EQVPAIAHSRRNTARHRRNVLWPEMVKISQQNLRAETNKLRSLCQVAWGKFPLNVVAKKHQPLPIFLSAFVIIVSASGVERFNKPFVLRQRNDRKIWHVGHSLALLVLDKFQRRAFTLPFVHG